jgi:hypothetical protein
MTSGPSLEGVDRIRQAAAYLEPYQPTRRKRRWPRWLTGKRLALILVADLVLGSVAWHYLTKPDPGAAAAAVQTVASAAAQGNWTSVYDNLCDSDQRRFVAGELQEAGGGALQAIGGLDHVTVTSVKSVTLPILGALHLPAAQVSGEIVPVVGQPSAYKVTAVRDVSGWRMCLSAGGFSSDAMSIDVPLGGQVVL